MFHFYLLVHQLELRKVYEDSVSMSETHSIHMGQDNLGRKNCYDEGVVEGYDQNQQQNFFLYHLIKDVIVSSKNHQSFLMENIW